MTPLTVMRFSGWTLVLGGGLFTALGVISVLTTQQLTIGGGVLLLIGVLSFAVGMRWAVHTPTELELSRWRRRTRKK